MTTTLDMDARAMAREVPWGVPLVTGLLWVVVSMVILTVDPTSAKVIAYMTGIVLLFAGVHEAVLAFAAEGWKWVHFLMAVLFLVSGFMAFTEPFQTFGILALLIGWYLVIKGIFEIVFAIAMRDEVPMWGLLLAAGIIELLIGMWALGYPGRSAWLLILWVGVGALMRGVTQIVMAFQVRRITRSA